MDYENWFPLRLAKLRMEKGVSARDMSLSLGQSNSYINKIENKVAYPSMTGFLYICDYLGITPYEFFYDENMVPNEYAEIMGLLEKLPKEKVGHIKTILKDMTD